MPRPKPDKAVRARSTRSDRIRTVIVDRVDANRKGWNARSGVYQKETGGARMYGGELCWGPNRFREAELGVLGELRGKKVLEIGCGAAQFGIECARLGAAVTGIDLSAEQIRHGRANVKAAGVDVTLHVGNAERLTRFRGDTFDVVVSDFAAGFMDLDRLLPEVRRVLAPGGFCALSWTSPILDCMTGDGSAPVLSFVYSYFDRTPWVDLGLDPTFELKRTYGDWVRGFARAGLVLEDLIEPQAARGAPHGQWPNYRWERTSRVPGTCIWKARKPAARA